MKKTRSVSPVESFSKRLLLWHKEQNRRQMPWKEEKDPYKIWLSEIILQQTRVEQGTAYYQRFIARFPDIKSLASAPDDQVFKLWEGLGYYSRCRNLLATARLISSERNGIFPQTYNEIRALKGIGPYTAAAISSFAYNEPYAVLDGNVYRVLSRLVASDIPTDSNEGKKFFTNLANDFLDKENPALYNQAIMDFGATICKPQQPLCNSCPANEICEAFRLERVADFPVKNKKLRTRERWFYYLVLEQKGLIAIRQRLDSDIWQQLYEFVLLEMDRQSNMEEILSRAEEMGIIKKGGYSIKQISSVYRQQLSHQRIQGAFISLALTGKPTLKMEWVNREELSERAFPVFIKKFISEWDGVRK